MGIKSPANYARLVRDYADILVSCFQVKDLRQALASPDALAFYVDFRMDAARLAANGKRARMVWKATTAGDGLSVIPTALRFFGLPAPPPNGTSTARQQRATARQRPDQAVISRKAASVEEVAAAAKALRAEGGSHSLKAAALLEIMFYNMLRPSDVEYIYEHGRLDRRRNQLVLHTPDKTHVRDRRQIRVLNCSLRQTFSTSNAFELFHKAVNTNTWRSIFHTNVLRTVRNAMKRHEHTLGSLRPGGVILHLRLGTDISIIKKIAGWSAASNVWLDHYIDLAAAAAAGS